MAASRHAARARQSGTASHRQIVAGVRALSTQQEFAEFVPANIAAVNAQHFASAANDESDFVILEGNMDAFCKVFKDKKGEAPKIKTEIFSLLPTHSPKDAEAVELLNEIKHIVGDNIKERPATQKSSARRSQEESPSTFILPTEALRSSLHYFHNALKPGWFDTDSRTLSLSDTEPAVFDLCARWIVTGDAGYEESGVDICQVTVWDFELTTDAWFLGDYLLSADFQNHCLGFLCFMNLRFDHLVQDDDLPEDEAYQATWQWGTSASVIIADMLATWG
ncbi:hypothetical protein K458DRAFT_381447 [Lentithecium fluviatile CBS 122367]|uniref:Uncharacterized protein n=1 Tax=Lentithecium fluviatile CBS 122367 TaxID=1168545 RepID=A0A6G1JMD8_9PLEO|nr:hypothetical protein K458DRAFT_381447 [Lentithecium fluviatile CBS 122367]